jgi:2-polyprenyl-3-methyl-5-hydroxy-6-metoxy-1,4-benzoquinol methylase
MSKYFVKRKVCPGCGHEGTTEILSSSFSNRSLSESIQWNFAVTGIDIFELVKDVEYQLHECSNCGLIFQKNCFREDFMGQLYQLRSASPEVQARDAAKPLDKSAYYAEEIVSLIKMLNRNPGDIDVLDYGMGWGHWCSMAKAYGCNSFGFDVSAQKKEFARENGITAIDELAGKRFDYINTEQVLEHVLYPLDTVKMLCESLKPGGILKISVPNGERINKKRLLDSTNPAINSLYLASPLMHINTFNHDAIVTMAEKAGLKPVRMPVKCQYSNVHLLNFKQGVKTILRPLYRRFMRTTYLHFINRGVPEGAV